jgi:hypothetical protein
MPGKNQWTYKYHLRCPARAIDEKFCTIADLVSKWGAALELTPKNVYHLRRKFYKHKFAGIEIRDIRERLRTRTVRVLA